MLIALPLDECGVLYSSHTQLVFSLSIEDALTTSLCEAAAADEMLGECFPPSWLRLDGCCAFDGVQDAHELMGVGCVVVFRLVSGSITAHQASAVCCVERETLPPSPLPPSRQRRSLDADSLSASLPPMPQPWWREGR